MRASLYALLHALIFTPVMSRGGEYQPGDLLRGQPRLAVGQGGPEPEWIKEDDSLLCALALGFRCLLV